MVYAASENIPSAEVLFQTRMPQKAESKNEEKLVAEESGI